MKFIHLIVVGDEDINKHLAGVSMLGTHKVFLFDIEGKRKEKTRELAKKLDQINISNQEVIPKGADYRDVYWSCKSILEPYLRSEDVCFAVNLSSGSRMALAAIEDALRTPITIGHGRPGRIMKAFRYELMNDGKGVRLAPLTSVSMNIPFIEPRGEWVKYPSLWSKIREKILLLKVNLPIKWLFFKRKLKRKLFK